MILSMLLSVVIAVVVSAVVAATVVHIALNNLAWSWYGLALVLVWSGYRVCLVAGLGWLMYSAIGE